MSKIAIDCDGVLADFGGSFLEFARKMFPGKVPDNYVQTDWDDDILTQQEQKAVWKRIKATPNFWLGLSAYADNVTALARFLVSTQNNDIYIVTSRAKTAGMTVARQTEWWLKSCGLSPVNNYMAILPVEDSNEKWRIYQYGGFDYSIDDKKETVQQCDMIYPALYTHKAYLLDRPWNQGAQVLRRVNSLSEFLKEIV